MNIEKLFDDINLSQENRDRFLNLTKGFILNFDSLNVRTNKNTTYFSIKSLDNSVWFIFIVSNNYTIGEIIGKNYRHVSIKIINNVVNYLRGSYVNNKDTVVTYSLYQDRMNKQNKVLAVSYPFIEFNNLNLRRLHELSLERIDIRRTGNYEKEIDFVNAFGLANQLFNNENIINEMEISSDEIDFGTKRNFKKITH